MLGETISKRVVRRKKFEMIFKYIILLIICSAQVQTSSCDELKPEIGGEENSMYSMVASMSNQNSEAKEEYSRGKKFKFKHNLNFDWSLKLDNLNRYELNWLVNYGENLITFNVIINKSLSNFKEGSDIFALGFSSNGQLESSDFCIIWYDLSHNVHLQDAKTNPQNQLELIDESSSHCKWFRLKYQSYNRRHQGQEEEDAIELMFSRPLDICNSNSYYTIDNGTTHLVWFTLRGPILALDRLDLNGFLSTNKQEELKLKPFEFGMKRVQLIASKAPAFSADQQTVINGTLDLKHTTKSMAIKMEKFKIPNEETTYWCKLFKLPNKFSFHKYHIVKYEPVIQEENKHIVHHMELFNCVNLIDNQLNELNDLYVNNGGWEGKCGDQLNRPKVTENCKKVIMAWAMGARTMDYPETVGLPIGGQYENHLFVMLEVHYNNVKLEPNLTDSSGLKFHYTNKLRQFDAGILEVGLEYTDKYAIPPNSVMPLVGHCVSECTRVGLVQQSQKFQTSKHRKSDGKINLSSISDEIFIFAGQLHTHLTGISSWTEIVREGKLLRELQRDNHYSPHFQEIRLLPEPVQLKAGDSLRHYCLYDTRDRANVTLGGEATTDEMCVTYLHYYPRVDLEVCKSSVDSQALEKYFAYLSREENQNTSQDTNQQKSVSENYKSIEWNRKRSLELLEFYHEAPLSIQCNRSNGDRFPGYWNGYLNANEPLVDDQREDFLLKTAERGRDLTAYRGKLGHQRHAQCKRSYEEID